MKTDSVRTNYILNTILQLLTLIIPLVTTPYVSRVLGVNRVGEYSYATAMVTYFVLLAILGTETYGQRQIAYKRDDCDELSDAFWKIFVFRIITVSISTLAYFSYLFLANCIDTVCIILSLNILNVALDITWFFRGIEKFRHVVFKNIIFKIINLILVFCFVKTQNDLWIYALIISSSTIIGSITIIFTIRKYIKKPVGNINPFSNFKDILLVFLPTIAIQVYTVLDKSMIGWITKSSYENGCYDKSEQISRISLTIITSVAAVVLPRVSNLFSERKENEAKEYLYKAYRLVWLLSIPICFGLVVVAPTFIPIFLGEGYEKSIPLLQIFSLLTIFVSLSYVTGLSYLVATKQQNIYTIAITIAAAANLIMNLFLIKILASIGAAIASVVAELLGCSIQISYCLFKKQLDWKRVFLPSIKYLISGAIMFGFVFLLSFVFPNNVAKLFVEILSGVIIYFVCLLLLRDKLVISETKSFFSKVFKKKNK